MISVLVQQTHRPDGRVNPVKRTRRGGIEFTVLACAATVSGQIGNGFLEIWDTDTGFMQAADAAWSLLSVHAVPSPDS